VEKSPDAALGSVGPAARPPQYRRPESVLIVIYTEGGEFLLLQRRKPAGFWQSVTGSLEWGEAADHAARREVVEETGITQGVLKNLQWTQVYEILPAFGRVYAPGITRNLEHAFALKLPEVVPVTLSVSEHAAFRWLPASEAIAQVSSDTNRAVIVQLRR
jgi:dATP pyrophosphohydrolase